MNVFENVFVAAAAGGGSKGEGRIKAVSSP